MVNQEQAVLITAQRNKFDQSEKLGSVQQIVDCDCDPQLFSRLSQFVIVIHNCSADCDCDPQLFSRLWIVRANLNLLLVMISDAIVQIIQNDTKSFQIKEI